MARGEVLDYFRPRSFSSVRPPPARLSGRVPLPSHFWHTVLDAEDLPGADDDGVNGRLRKPADPVRPQARTVVLLSVIHRV